MRVDGTIEITMSWKGRLRALFSGKITLPLGTVTDLLGAALERRGEWVESEDTD